VQGDRAGREKAVSVVLISRGTMSGGQIIGRCLAERMGFRCVSREELSGAVNAHGGLANRILNSLPRAARDYAKFSELRRPYKILMRMALLEYAREGNLAYLGYSGHLLLEGIPHFLKVRLLAPLRMRVKMTMERLDCTETNAAEFIEKFDEERVSWARFMYGRDIRDPNQYDLCINMDKAPIEAVCDLLVYFVKHAAFQPTSESMAALDDVCLATSVLTALVLRPDTLALEIGATARSGRVLLEGPFLEDEPLATVCQIAQAVPGVREVEYQPGYAPALAFAH
jgi:cytidylate kinase